MAHGTSDPIVLLSQTTASLLSMQSTFGEGILPPGSQSASLAVPCRIGVLECVLVIHSYSWRWWQDHQIHGDSQRWRREIQTGLKAVPQHCPFLTPVSL